MNQPSFPSKLNAMRIGAVSYLNTKPLIETLSQRLGPACHLSLALPSQLASQLASAKIDVGLIPAIEFFRGPARYEGASYPFDEYRMISNACIACRGIVRSVRLFFRLPPHQAKSIAIDEGSRTSVALALILLKMRYGIQPRLVPLPIAADPNEANADAVLVIGDRAMHPDRFATFQENWDLGLEWFQETGLPFVFAMWVGRQSMAHEELAEQFEAARDDGVQRIENLAEKYASNYAMSLDACHEYLSMNLRFTMDRAELDGLKTFHRLASELDLLPNSPTPNWQLISPTASPDSVIVTRP